ncbi:unnamed protein product [Ectocarpus sp. CCAP 1310/34]|nr:unnamed protein product [Ectocarpus sp. CCAP 1310/34]
MYVYLGRFPLQTACRILVIFLTKV